MTFDEERSVEITFVGTADDGQENPAAVVLFAGRYERHGEAEELRVYDGPPGLTAGMDGDDLVLRIPTGPPDG